MKISATKKALTGALDQLMKVVPTRSSNPLLTSLHARVTDQSLVLTGSNLEIDLQITLPVAAEGEGAIAIPAHLFRHVVANLPGELVEMQLRGQTLHIESADSRNKVQVREGREFTPITFHEEGTPVPVPGPELTRVFQHALTNIRSDPYQSIYRSVSAEFHQAHTRVVGSDGHRVTYDELETPAPVEEDRALLIPARSLPQLFAVLAGPEPVLFLGDGRITARSSNMRAQIRLADGEYPVYERAIPKHLMITAQLPASQLAEVFNRVAVFSDATVNNRTELTLYSGELTLQAANDYGETEDRTAATITGERAEEGLSVFVNATFFPPFLRGLEGDICLSLTGSQSPYVLTSLAHPRLLTCGVTLKP